jgi:hypothetical protein
MAIFAIAVAGPALLCRRITLSSEDSIQIHSSHSLGAPLVAWSTGSLLHSGVGRGSYVTFGLWPFENLSAICIIQFVNNQQASSLSPKVPKCLAWRTRLA